MGGARLGGAIPEAVFTCAGRPLICHTIEALARAHEFCAATVVIHPDDRDLYDATIARSPTAARPRLRQSSAARRGSAASATASAGGGLERPPVLGYTTASTLRFARIDLEQGGYGSGSPAAGRR